MEEEAFSIVNCPFCEEDPLEDGHHRAERVPIKIGSDGVIVHLMLTCLVVFPEAMEKGKALQEFQPHSFLLIEEIVPPSELQKQEVGKSNWDFMEKMGRKLDQ